MNALNRIVLAAATLFAGFVLVGLALAQSWQAAVVGLAVVVIVLAAVRAGRRRL